MPNPFTGGLSYLSDLYGLTCDNVVNFEVRMHNRKVADELTVCQMVLADGSIVNANAHHNQDLFQVMKGGANNFGR